jgi:hypothetical protein
MRRNVSRTARRDELSLFEQAIAKLEEFPRPHNTKKAWRRSDYEELKKICLAGDFSKRRIVEVVIDLNILDYSKHSIKNMVNFIVDGKPDSDCPYRIIED